MPQNNKKKTKKPADPLIGRQAKPTVLDNTTKLDIDTDKQLADAIIYAGLSNKLDASELDKFTSISNARDQVYQLIDTMCNDSAVSSIVRTYAEDATETADNGHIVWCESNNEDVSKFVNYLLNVMNVDKNIYSWIYSLVKYGDCYLRLYRESDYEDKLFNRDKITKADTASRILNEDINLNIHSTDDAYSYYVEMVPDPGTMFELTRFGKTYGYIETPNNPAGFDYSDVYTSTNQANGSSALNYNYRYKSSDVNIYQADDFVHACLEDDVSRYPETVNLYLTEDDYNSNLNSTSYTVRRGKSLLYDAYKIWREKQLLEAAALLSRLTRSGLVRKVSVEVGDMPKNQVMQTLREVKTLFEQKSAIQEGQSFAEYTNPGAVENFIYVPTHNGQGNISVESIGGDYDPKQLTDLDWWNNKFYASFGIPKQYFGYCLRGNTKVRLLNGETLTIKEMFENREAYLGKEILSCSLDGIKETTTIANITLTNEHAEELIRFTLSNGKIVETTKEHQMMLNDGYFVPAQGVKIGDALMSLDEVVTVINVEYTRTDEAVYDITVASDNHTFALDAGIFVHNCDDGAGFNGGSSLTIISSVYAKAVKRLQNSMLQAITDAINLILLNKGLRSYLNAFVLRMKAPVTQEEKDYRESLTNRINVISNMLSLFNDIETRSRKLIILKDLVAQLHYGDDILEQIQKEIDAAEAAEAAEAKEKENTDSASEDDSSSMMPEVDLGSAEDMPEFGSGANEAFIPNPDSEQITEAGSSTDALIESNEDLPTPEEADDTIDFTEVK